MPIREFKCKDGHVSEKILLGSADYEIMSVPCVFCNKKAKRLEWSQTGDPLLIEGVGGFHKPHSSIYDRKK